jgi:hypothetical protein
LLVARLGLGDFLGAKASLHSVQLGLVRCQRRRGALLLGDQVEGLELDERVARFDVLAFFDIDLGHAAADAGAEANFVGLDEAADTVGHRAILAVKDRRRECCRDEEDRDYPFDHATPSVPREAAARTYGIANRVWRVKNCLLDCGRTRNRSP